MKFVFKKYYWIFVSLGIIINVVVFMFVSQRLESYVVEDLVSKQDISEV